MKGTHKLQGIKNFQNVKCVYFNPILIQILFYELLIFPVLSSCMTYHQFVTRLTPRVPLVEKELPTLYQRRTGYTVANCKRKKGKKTIYKTYTEN
jgi:hypothetical protein